MASAERHRKLGELAELREKHGQLVHRAEGIIESLNLATYVGPTSTPFALDPDKVVNYANELRDVIREGQQVEQGIEKLKDELGER